MQAIVTMERLLRATLVVLVGGSSLVACAGDPADHSTDATEGSVQAFVNVARTDSRGSVRAEAVAGFAQVPAAVDARAVLAIVGLRRELPEVGQCITQGPRNPNVALAPIDRVELLDAGEVSVEASGRRTKLAPNAFPTVTDLISGVLYTSRDRSAEPLPPASSYRIQAAGGSAGGVQHQPFAVVGQAPSVLEGVTLGGTPLFNLSTVSIKKPVDLTWRTGTADGSASDAGLGDVVYFEMVSTEARESIVCAFRDDDGAGSVPATAWSAWNTTGSGRVALHRLRTLGVAQGAVDHTELCFDFAVESPVTFAE